MLAVGGGASGLLPALWTTRLLERVMRSVQSTLPLDLDLSLDWRVIAFATILSLAVIGEAFAIPATRALARVQTGIRPAALSMHVAAAVIWVAVAFVACDLPARRASHIHPMEALRHE